MTEDLGTIKFKFARYKEIYRKPKFNLPEILDLEEWFRARSSKSLRDALGSENTVWLYQRILWLDE